MRYNLESTLPINAFSPRGGRGPFTRGMTLEGGGGGGGGGGIPVVGPVLSGVSDALSGVGDAIGGVLGTDGGGGGILGGLADFDKSVAKSIPGGWGGLAETAAIMAASYFGGPVGAAAARGAFDYTHGGEDRKNALRNAAEQLAVSYAGGPGGGGALGAGVTKAGLEYTHGGADRENALKSGAIAGGTQLALQGAKDYFNDTSGIEGGMNNEFGAGTSGYGEANAPLDSNVSQTPSGNYITDYSTSTAPQTDPFRPDVSAPDISAPNAPTPDVFNDGYSPDISPDYVQVPGDPGFNMQPALDPYLGALPTSNIPTDMTVGTQFEGPNGPEIVAPNGKTYLMRDLYLGLESSVVTPTAPDVTTPDVAPTDTLTNISSTTPKSVVDTANDFNPDPNTKVITNDAGKQVNITDKSAPASPETQKMADMGMMDRLAQMPGYTYDAAAQYVKTNPLTTAALAYGAYNMLGGQQQPQQPTGQPTGSNAPGYAYTPPYYGTAGPMADPYILKNKVNASNVYSRTAPTSRYAEGGEVKHFGIGGIANTLTKVFQPVEKAILQPIGKIPGVKEALPYAGLIAAPFIASPMAAAGVGALTSGFGTPGSGFNMKRAIMGGIASYGLSNIGAGLEEAGATPLPDGAPTLNTDVESQYGGFYGNEGKTDQLSGKGSGFFRSPEAMSKGVSNFMGGNTYDQAATAFGSKAGMGSAAAALMGTTGIMGIDETEKQLKADKAAGDISDAAYQEQMARIAAGKASAERAIKAHPYQFAVGGSVDDELGMDEAMGIPQGNLQNGFMGGVPAMNYAMGGNVGNPRFLSGGGDGMSDSIKATIDNKREARLADGEFVVPADVVSGLGNGSSKAGAKQLYAMMDRVRQSRTGTVKQGKQINPKKVLKV